MIWLLDTNVVSDWWKPRPNPGAEASLEENKEDCAERGKQFWTGRTTRDSAIAAIARAWSLTVVTRDVRHFPFVAALNPFTI
jgi:predicted nucleic acid-binding protein